MYSEITRAIKISVDTSYVDEQSEPEDFHFVFDSRGVLLTFKLSQVMGKSH